MKYQTVYSHYPRLCLIAMAEEIIIRTNQRLINNCKKRKAEMIRKYIGQQAEITFIIQIN